MEALPNKLVTLTLVIGKSIGLELLGDSADHSLRANSSRGFLIGRPAAPFQFLSEIASTVSN